MSYSIFRTDRANEQLFSAIQYIMEDSGSVDIALRYLDGVEKAIKALEDAPYMGAYPRYRTLKRQGFRVLVYSRHLIFYKVNEEQQRVMIYAIFDAKQNYINLI